MNSKSKKRTAKITTLVAFLTFFACEKALAESESCTKYIQAKFGEIAREYDRLEPVTFVSWNGEKWQKCDYERLGSLSYAQCGGKKFGIDIDRVIDAKDNEWILPTVYQQESKTCKQVGPREFHEIKFIYQKKRVEGTENITVERKYYDTNVYKF